MRAMVLMSALYVEISGPDPKAVKFARRPFSTEVDGTTLYSGSGVLWDQVDGRALALVPASLLVGFLMPDRRESLDQSDASHLVPLTR